ncbi:MAG: 3-hydroxyisobutyrate dehydrogenase-like beta-hydroxyacid dehydrogenase [Gammaproteobacteria bacterium]|jgi:3-hydroxyisobutyrate dehydrogenase-like beta-hydroxyacid dehydrogenase
MGVPIWEYQYGSTNMKAGFIGTGSMGLPLASNILEHEQSLVAFDINPNATASLAQKQAQIAQSPLEVAMACDVVFACMPSIDSLNAVVTGDDGVLNGTAMKLFVNLGTMGTAAITAIEAQLAHKGVLVLDCPVTGGVKRAWAGDITAITSGPRAAYEQALPLLETFTRDIHYVGETVGQAQLVKVCNNIMSFTNLVIGLEAMVMAAKGGVDPEKALAVFNAGSGQNSATLNRIPDSIMSRQFDGSAPMYITAKDAMLWRVESERLEAPHTVGAATYQVFQQAIAMGLRDGDLSELVKVVERDANFELPKTRE